MPLAKVRPVKGNMNYFVMASVPLYIGAGITSLANGNLPMAAVWFCYASANAFLLFAEFKA